MKNSLAQFYHFHYEDIGRTSLRLLFLVVTLALLSIGSAQAQQEREGMILIPFGKDLHVSNPTNRPMGLNGEMTVESWVWVGPNLDLPFFGFKGEASEDGIIAVRYLAGQTNKWQVVLRDIQSAPAGLVYKYDLPYKSDYSGTTTIGGSWNHIAVTLSGNSFKLYINGELAVEEGLRQAANHPWPNILPRGEGNRTFGGDLFGLRRTFWMSEVRIWKSVLEEAEIAEYYDEEVNVNHPHWDDLVRYYHGTEQSSGSFPSRSPNYAYDAVGDAELSTDLSVVGSFPVVKPPRIGDLADLQAEDCVWEDLTLDVDWEELNDLPDYINGNNVSYQLSRNGVEVRRKDTDDYDEKNHVGGSVYEYALRTYWNIDGVPYYSDDAATVEARVREQVDPPTGFSATRDECGGIELTWNSPNTPQYWRIQRGTDDHFNFWDEYIASDIDGGVNRYTDETASPERDFYYRIQAYGEGDNGCDVFGEWTTADVIGFTRETPRAPNNLSLIQDLDNKELQLTWNNRDDLSTDGYVVKREKLDGSDVTYFTIDGKDNTSFTDNGIELCQTYRYTVGSFNECNSDEESDANFASSDVTGNISQDLTNMISAFDASKAYYPDRVRLEWDVFGSLSQVDRFRISRSPAGENNFDLIAVVADGLIYDDETAIGGVLYDYKVAAEAQCEDKIIISNEMIDVGFITSYGVANGHIEYEGGNPVEDVAVTVERTNGKQVGHSVQFTGSDYLETTESFSFENDALTIEFWAKKEADEAGDLFDWNNGDAVPAPGQILKISYTSDGSINVYGGSGYEFIYNETNDKSDEWTHWAYVYDNAEVLDSRLYKNGELVMEGDLNSVDNNSMIDNNDFFAKLGNEFEGNLDELRVWNIARTAEEIQRDYGRIINAANSDLKLYYRFDEGIGTNTYDVSSDGIIFNKVDAVFTNLSEFSDDIPTSSQLGVRGVTDQFGDYSIEYIPYLGGGEVFRAVPSLGQHEFSPNSRSIFVGDGSKTANGLDFLDISSFEVIGVVRYDNTDFPVEGAVLKIDGVEVVGPDNKVVRTGADGKFTINVPIGYHYISVEKDGHTFSKGHFPELDEFGSIVTYEFNGPLGGEIEFFDDTKVTVVGKVAGGSVEAGKKSGFGIGFNNVDVADVEFQLQSLGYDLATDDDAITDIFTVQTDATTGEYIIELIPESWVVNKAGNDTYFTEADDLPVIDLSANIYPVEETEVIDAETEADSTIVYNKRQDFIIRVTPQVSLLDSEGNPFSGNETISYVDGENTVELDLSSADNPFPFIMVEKNRQYESVVKVKEVYYNPNHPVEGAYYDEVNVEGAEISIVNNLSERSPSAEGTTNADGEFSHDFYVGPPDVSINPIERNKSFTRNLEVYVVTPGQSLELIKTAYILGDRVIDGTDFVTYGAEIPQIVLHDPPGSNSYAYVETGSSFSGAKSWEYSNSSSTSLDHVTYAGSDLDLGGPGATAPTRFWNNAEYGMEISKGFSYNGEYVETFTFNRRIETSSDPEDVGSMADVYIGTADNLFMSRTNRLRVMLKADADAAGHSYIQPDAGSDLVLAVSQGLAITDKEAPTIFVYTQRHIIENVIPTLMELRDDLLLNSGKYTTNQPPESRWFGLNNDNPSLIADNPGSSFSDNLSYEFLLDPADEMDSVAFLNQQISTWISTIALNEAQKIESTLVNNISIDGSVGAYEASTEQDFTTSFNYTRTHNWDAYANADFGTFTAGNGFNLRYDFDLGIGLETSDEDAITNTIKFGYVIDESDVGDYYSIDIKTNDDISVYNKNKFSGWYPNKRELVDNLFLGGGGYIATGAVGGAKLGAYGLVMRRISKFVTESSVRKSAVAGAVFFAADVAFHIADLTQMSMYTNEVVEDMSGNLEFDVSNFMISSPIFSIRGGASSCPYEGEELSLFYQPNDQPATLHTATLQREVPVLKVSESARYDVPESEQAIFTLQLQNESATGTDLWYDLGIVEGTNPFGAIVLVDGLTADRSFYVPAGGTLTKTLTVEKGTVLEYDSIGIVLTSRCQTNLVDFIETIADTVYVTAHFLPECSDIALGGFNDNWVINYDDNHQAQVTLEGFDINHPTLERIDFQYKTLSGNPITTKAYFKDAGSAAYSSFSGDKDVLDAGSESFMWDVESLADGQYQLISRAVCTDGSVKESPVVTGTIDRSTPVPFGTPEPADGILSIGDDISILFNEEIASGLIRDGNISITGVLNAYEVTHNVSLQLDGIDDYVEIPGVSLNDKSFTIEFWLKREVNTSGAIFTKGAGSDKVEIAFKNDGTIDFILGNGVLNTDPSGVYSSVYPENGWHHWSFNYDQDGGIASIYIDDQILETGTIAFNSQPTENAYLGNINGASLAAQIHELRIWEKPLSISESVATMNQTLTGSEFSLYGYWPMDEAVGENALDLASGRHMSFVGTWLIEPGGYAYDFNGGQFLTVNAQKVVVDELADMTVEFWFKAGSHSDTATFISNGFGYADSTYKMEIYADHLTGNIIVHNNDVEFIAVEENVLDNEWHHFAFVVDRRSIGRAYLDGELKNQMIGTSLAGLAGSDIWVGARTIEVDPANNIQDHYLTGQMDEIRFWNVNRSVKLMEMYRHTKLNGNEVGLLGYLPFEHYVENAGIKVMESTLEDQSEVSDALAIAKNGDTFTQEVPQIKDARPVQDIPFTYAVSADGIVINLNIDESRVEGQVLEVAVQNVQDLYGNRLLSPRVWNVFMERNPLIWQEDQIALETSAENTLSFSAVIVNRSGVSQSFTLDNLPVWLSVSETSGVISPNATREITFEVHEGLNIGRYERAIQLSSDFGYDETLNFSVAVLAEAPDWTVDVNQFESTMNMFGLLKIDGVISTDEHDLVGVFVGDEVRGVANPYYEPAIDGYLLSINIYGENGDELTFKVWDAGTNSTYIDVTPDDLTFTESVVMGTPLAPVEIETSGNISMEIPLNAGWNWISVNLDADDNTIAGLFGEAAKDKFQVKNNLLSVEYSEMIGWLSTTKVAANSIELDPEMGYKVYSTEAATVAVSGLPYDPSAFEITVAEGWNYIGFIPQVAMTVEEALAYMQPQNGDVVKGQGEFAVFVTNVGWIGSLNTMRPGKGYVLYSNTATTLIYPAYSSISATSGRSEFDRLPENLQLNTGEFESDMSFIASFDGLELAGDELLGVYHNDELRGVASPVKVSEDTYSFFLTAFGIDGEEFTFKLFDKEGTIIQEPEEQAKFTTNEIIGQVFEPYMFVVAEQPDVTPNDIAPNVWPNPFKDQFTLSHGLSTEGTIRIRITDLSGRTYLDRTVENSENQLIEFSGSEISSMIRGLYIVSVTDGIKTEVHRIKKD